MRTVAAMLVLAIALVGCDVEDPEGEGAAIVDTPGGETTEPAETTEEETPEEEPAEEETTEEEPAEEATGTRQNPLELGTTAQVGDWEVTVLEVTRDATEQVVDENQFNDPPVEGRQFVMARIAATYTGEDSGTFWLDMTANLVGAGGNTFGTATDDRCGVIPDPIDDTGETFPDGSIEGNVCWSVPSDQIEGGAIFVEPTFSDGRTFWAVG